jgi:hypothetical protein
MSSNFHLKGRKDSNSKNPTIGGKARSFSSPHSPAVGLFLHAIFLACRGWRTTIDQFIPDNILTDFARRYAETNPAKGNCKLEYLPSEVQDALAAFQGEFQRNHESSLFNHFRRMSKRIAPSDEIDSFAEWYILESRKVSINDAAKPSEAIIQEMIEFFKSELERICPKWYLYKVLFGALTDYVSLEFIRQTKVECLSFIRSSFNGTLPEDGIHGVPHAFIMRLSRETRFHISGFLKQTGLAVSLALLYHHNGRLVIDKDYKTRGEYLIGKICCVFVERIGKFTRRKSCLQAVMTGGCHIGGVYTQNDQLVEDGICEAQTDSGDIGDFTGVTADFTRTRELLVKGIPGWTEFMSSIGAHPFKVCFDSEE